MIRSTITFYNLIETASWKRYDNRYGWSGDPLFNHDYSLGGDSLEQVVKFRVKLMKSGRGKLVASLKLYFLGSPRIELHGSPVEFDTRKAVALLAYLAVAVEQQRRETLAALLWPDYDHEHAMGLCGALAIRKALAKVIWRSPADRRHFTRG
jgi:two-component SAPR family response regulator